MKPTDPFMFSYSPFSGARTPDLWKYLWRPKNTLSVERYGYRPIPNVRSPHLTYKDFVSPIPQNADLRLTECCHASPPGASLLRLAAGLHVRALYSPKTNTVVEVFSDIFDALQTVTTVEEFVALWLNNADHYILGNPIAMIRTLIVLRLVHSPQISLISSVGEDSAGSIRIAGTVYSSYNPADTSLRLFNFANGDRIRLSNFEPSDWADLDGKNFSPKLVSNDPLIQRLRSGLFIHLELSK